jgi:hypothetical protein
MHEMRSASNWGLLAQICIQLVRVKTATLAKKYAGPPNRLMIESVGLKPEQVACHVCMTILHIIKRYSVNNRAKNKALGAKTRRALN